MKKLITAILLATALSTNAQDKLDILIEAIRYVSEYHEGDSIRLWLTNNGFKYENYVFYFLEPSIRTREDEKRNYLCERYSYGELLQGEDSCWHEIEFFGYFENGTPKSYYFVFKSINIELDILRPKNEYIYERLKESKGRFSDEHTFGWGMLNEIFYKKDGKPYNNNM